MGGGMSYHLACHAADVFAAVAPHAFDLTAETIEACMPARPIGVFAQRRTEDNVVPYAGGRGVGDKFTFLGAEATLQRWVELDGTTVLYPHCSEGVEGGDHGGGSAELAWTFLARHRLP